MIELFVDNLSPFGHDIDTIFDNITYIVGFWFILAQATIFYFLFRFREKPGVKAKYYSGESKSEKKWLAWPHNLVLICDVFILVWTVQIWYDVKQDLPEPDVTIRVTGQQWAWTFTHPGPDGELDTNDDIVTINDLHVEVGKVYHFELTSLDVLHSFSVPVFRLKQDALPGRVIMGWFKAESIGKGEYDVQCAEMCGIGHGLMASRMTISSENDHKAWQASMLSADNKVCANTTMTDLDKKGEQL